MLGQSLRTQGRWNETSWIFGLLVVDDLHSLGPSFQTLPLASTHQRARMQCVGRVAGILRVHGTKCFFVLQTKNQDALIIQSDNRVGYLKWEPCQKLRGLRGTHLGNVPPATDPPAIPLMPFSRQALCCHSIPGHQGAPVTALGATLTPTEENPAPHLSRYYDLTPAHLFSPLYCL